MLKEFGPKDFKVKEGVAQRPSLHEYGQGRSFDPNIFCLRIDADEYTPESFDSYLPLFEKYASAVTIFFNAYSFLKGSDRILRCRDLGVDIQSHAFYHYTYNDYQSNLYNIRKAKLFFQDLGIDTTGFASPLGRWNKGLTRALAEEGYKYSSEFSYDYMGFPSFVSSGEGDSRVLEIPVFPVAPELFFQEEGSSPSQVVEYYKRAIDFLVGEGLPVLIYAHTNPDMPMIPSMLEEIVSYAVGQKKLKPMSMTGIYDLWAREGTSGDLPQDEENRGICTPGDEFVGVPVSESAFERLKDMLKTVLDFERVTPAGELKCGKSKKILKLLARKVL
ncbi:polysaccharide deacetylase family protein [Candidatus Omnitrophota bacterium]